MTSSAIIFNVTEFPRLSRGTFGNRLCTIANVWAAKAKSLGTGLIGLDDAKSLLLLLDMDIVVNPIDIFPLMAAVRSPSYGPTIDFHF